MYYNRGNFLFKSDFGLSDFRHKFLDNIEVALKIHACGAVMEIPASGTFDKKRRKASDVEIPSLFAISHIIRPMRADLNTMRPKRKFSCVMVSLL